MNLLILIPSALDKFRLNLLQRTWLPLAQNAPNVEVVMAGNSWRGEPFPPLRWDTYDQLPSKMEFLFHKALNDSELKPWDFIFKCDDDTYVHVDRLVKFPKDHPYIGSLVNPGPDWPSDNNYASGGGGYFVSREAVNAMLPHFPTAMAHAYPLGAEDLIVGRCLSLAGVQLKHCPQFTPYGTVERRPLPNNDLVTTHRINPHLFLQTHYENFPTSTPFV